MWTWRDGGNEVDVFEYHPDNPDLLELTNHVREGQTYLHHPAVSPGAVVDLGVTFGRRSVDWSLNGTQVFADGRGVGSRWYAYLVVNLSVCAYRRYPGPDPGTTELSYRVENLTVRRRVIPNAAESRDDDAAAAGTGS